MRKLSTHKYITNNHKEGLASMILTYAENTEMDKNSLKDIFNYCLCFFDGNAKLDTELEYKISKPHNEIGKLLS
ncbi:MAG: hypothetical protein LBV67_09030 [Streptococcaceae bacterium]|jgi:hypothetical protein|nr:hypothetical protein [Streptococcaceae bacterium]